MARIGKIGPDVRAELRKRSVDPDADVHRLVEDFVEDEGGARILHSEGDGEVALLIPAKDGYEGPKKVSVAPWSDTTKILDVVDRQRTVEIEGVGRFHEFLLSPLQYKRAVAGEERPKIALKGAGPGGEWSPLGFGGWFFEDLRLLTDLATRGGLEVRPDVELDPKDPRWKKVSSEERAFLEATLGRAVPEVVHTSMIEEALAKAGDGNNAIAGAVESLRLSLEAGAPGVKPAAPAAVEPAFAAAKPGLEKLFGATIFQPGAALPRALLEVVEDALAAAGRDGEAALVRQAIRKEAVDPAALAGAVDRALGAGFSEARRPTLRLVDAVIDRFGERLGHEEVAALRGLRAELDFSAEVELFGEELAVRPLGADQADAKLRELVKHLKGRTGVDEAAVFALAARITAAINVPREKPAVIIVSGEGGPGLDAVLGRAKKLVSDAPLEIQAAADLRLDDPVGYLVGSPANEPGSARGVLVREAPEGRFVSSISGLEHLSAQVPDAEDRATYQKSFWSFVGQLERDGWFRGFDPDDPARAKGGKVALEGGVLFFHTSESPAELAKKMPPEVWAQLAPRVIGFGRPDAKAAVAEVEGQLRDHLVEAYGFGDAHVELAPSAASLVRELAEAGMKPAQLQRLVVEPLVDRLYFAAVDGALAPRVRIELARGLTGKERGALRDGWLEGRMQSVAGLGACPFVIFDAGRFEVGAKAAVSPELVKKKAENAELQRLRDLVAEYQVGAEKDDRQLRGILAANEKLAKRGDAAEVRIDQLRWLNARATAEIKDLQKLNQIANDTIGKLKGDLVEANERISGLNADLKKAKDAGAEIKAALDVAKRERDAIHAALRTTEREFEGAIRTMAERGVGQDPMAAFDLIAASAGRDEGRYLNALMRQMLMVATGRALERSMQHARSFNKWDEITRMANGYVRASHALGVPTDRRVMEGFERAARLSGNGWARDLGRDWVRTVGEAAILGEDPDMQGFVMRNLLRYLGIRI